MFPLRSGEVTLDPRLDRTRQVDLRSLGWLLPESAGGPITADQYSNPRSYTWALDERLDQGEEGACFPAGTWVRMADGSHKSIEDVRTLDEVVTAKGRTGRVMQTMVRHANGLVAIRLRGHAAVAMTPEHPVLTQRGYVAAKDITTADRVAVPRYLPHADDDTLDVTRLVDTSRMRGVVSGTVNTGGIMTEVAPLPELLYRTPALGRLLGLYAAEGHVTDNKVIWTFGGHELDTLATETADLIKSVLDAKPRVQQRPNGAVNVILYGKTWRRLFQHLVPGTTKHGDKHLAPLVTSGPPAFLAAVLDGWLDGDGHSRRNETSGVSVSHRLALDMHAIANGLGRMPIIRGGAPSLNNHAETRQYRWDIAIPTGNGNRQPITDSAVWRKVSSVEPQEFDGWVYNFHVEGDESYVANGLGVHNCVGFGFAHELAARPGLVNGITNDWARERIYWRAQEIDPWPGGAFPGASPFYEGTSVLAGAQVVKALGLYREYRWALNIDDLIAAVGYHGPAVIGTDWYAGMFDTDAEGYIHPRGRILGGHCVAIVAVKVIRNADGTVDFLRSYFTIQNSWGPSWGFDGRCRITFAETLVLWSGGDWCLPVGRVAANV